MTDPDPECHDHGSTLTLNKNPSHVSERINLPFYRTDPSWGMSNSEPNDDQIAGDFYGTTNIRKKNRGFL